MVGHSGRGSSLATRFKALDLIGNEAARLLKLCIVVRRLFGAVATCSAKNRVAVSQISSVTPNRPDFFGLL